MIPWCLRKIPDVDFRHLVNRVPEGATFTILSDSCHSGGLIDKEKEQIGPCTTPNDAVYSPHSSHRPKHIPFQSILQHFTSLTSKTSTDIGAHLVEVFGQDASLMFRAEPIGKPSESDEGILLSGCQTNETSADVEIMENGGKPCGAFSSAVQMVLGENRGGLSNREIVVMAREILSLRHFDKQHPWRERFCRCGILTNSIRACTAAIKMLMRFFLGPTTEAE